MTNADQSEEGYQQALRLLERLEEASSETENQPENLDKIDNSSAKECQQEDYPLDDISTWFPLYLPIDKAFEAKYLAARKTSKKTAKEHIYLFLEHPAGWFGFIYHMLVYLYFSTEVGLSRVL